MPKKKKPSAISGKQWRVFAERYKRPTPWHVLNEMAADERRKSDCRRAGVDESTPRHVLNEMAADERRKADCRRAGVDEFTPRHVQGTRASQS